MLRNRRGTNGRDAGFGEVALVVTEWVAEPGRIGRAGAEEEKAGSVRLECGDD